MSLLTPEPLPCRAGPSLDRPQCRAHSRALLGRAGCGSSGRSSGGWGGCRSRRRRQHCVRGRAALAQELAASFQALPQRDLWATGIATAGALALVKLCDVVTSRGLMDRKLSRKVVHTLAGPGYALCWPLFSADPNARFLAVLVPSLNLLRLLALGTGLVDDPGTVRAMSREGDRQELLRGPLYYVVALMVATVVWWRDSVAGVTALSMLCAGDGLADIVGRRFGASNPLPWNKQKSWAGSAAMLLGGALLSMGFTALFCRLGYFACNLEQAAASIASIAVLAAFIESLPINHVLDDNISVPSVAAVLGATLIDARLLL